MRTYLTRGLALLLMCLCGFSSPGAAENVLTIAIGSDPANIDPRFGIDANSYRVWQLTSNGLLQKDPLSNLIPDLAERWENPDNKTYIFYLKKGITFHDGTEFTAEDVKYTFETILDPELKSPRSAGLQHIKNIDILDPYTIRFTLKDVYSPFLIEMVQAIVPKTAVEQQAGKRFTEHLIGTGAFRLVEWTHDEQLVFEANPEYFEGAPKLDKIIIKIIPDDASRFLQLKEGDVDFIQNAVSPDMVAIAQESQGMQVLTDESVIIYYLGFNLEDPILKNVKVRQAIAYAIDRQALVDHLMKGQASLATGLLAPNNWAYEPEVNTYDYDLEKAKQLLDEAGYPDPDDDGPEPRFSLIYKTSTAPLRIRIGELLQEQLKKVGIKISGIEAYEWEKFYEDVKSGNVQIFSLRWVGITEPNIFHSIFHSSMAPPDGRNRGHYHNPRIDELTELGYQTINLEERKKIYSEIQKILAEDLPYIFLWYPYNIVVMDKRIKGFTLYPDGDFTSFKHVWIEE
ncbi:ABC peptide transporter, periplasmic ligand binding protein [Candidatus Vecturithrix granuli]|uniref:ABC peptide transporter, periplasmic ligand binding protein n=1 Tax=Vecturithrix granuli TaxID=1499967 RepID=A0A081CAV0_VECG1|nr:ABC peptide transporter, periplasmic ligand binding protein [Candidatus Vecturithrix granuli]